MVSTAQQRKPSGRSQREIKRISDGREPADLVPVVLDPVEVQVPLRTVPVEVRNVAVAVPVLPDGTSVQNIAHTTTPQILSELYLIRNLEIP